MELKWWRTKTTHAALSVLIVPLWNWNNRSAACSLSSLSSNCTFMELKLHQGSQGYAVGKRSNCTFMELKLVNHAPLVEKQSVLIVPLWNWNLVCAQKGTQTIVVLIVPLWNWNKWASIWETKSECSNCTFMELKLGLSSKLNRRRTF